MSEWIMISQVRQGRLILGGGVPGCLFCRSAAHFRRFLDHINVVPKLFNTSPGVVRSDHLYNVTAKEMTWNVTVDWNLAASFHVVSLTATRTSP